MTGAPLTNPASTLRLILIPAVISLAMTLLRLTGELLHWSEEWFSTGTSGVIPTGTNWLFGITWLALPLGAYFACKLLAAGQVPPQTGKAFGHALAGLALVIVGLFFAAGRLPIPFPQIIISYWVIMATGAAIAWRAWPGLGKTLLAYGLAARIPVVVVMFLAMRGNWGTHYDYVGMPPPFQMSLWPKFFWLAFFPQLIFWVSYTILMGVMTGSLALAAWQWRQKLRVAETVST
ncbi:MAG: hypothetical protein ACREOO_15845 [bacterium]